MTNKILTLSKCLGVAIMLLSLQGCWTYSLHEAYDSKHPAVLDPALVGNWQFIEPGCEEKDKEICPLFLHFEPVENHTHHNCYRAEYSDQLDRKTPLEACLVRIGHHEILDLSLLGHVFLDLSLRDPADKRREHATKAMVAHLIPVHTFWKITHDKSSLKMHPIDADWLWRQHQGKKFDLPLVSRAIRPSSRSASWGVLSSLRANSSS